MRKALYATVSSIASSIAILLLLLAYLLFSHSGNSLLWQQISDRIEGLQGELVEGKLLSGWTFENLGWEDNRLKFHSRKITLQWQLSALLNGELPVSLIDIDQLSLLIKLPDTEASEQPPASSASEPVNIPVRIIVDQINIRNFTLSSPGTHVSLGSLEADLTLDEQGLSLNEVQANQLKIHIPQNSKTGSSQTDNTPIELPEINLPIPIKLHQLTLTNAHYEQGSISEQFKKLTLSFNGEKTRLSDIQLSVDHAMASASLNGKINLSDNYPLTVAVNALIHQPLLDGELKNEHIKLQTSGTLDNLQLELNTSGSINAQLRGSIQPVTPDLPFDLSLNWQSLSWPLLSRPKQISAHNGSLIVAGSLKGYDLRLDTTLEVPKQPATSLVLKGRGDLEQLVVKQLRLNAPGGYLNLDGQLKWQNEISWQGNTQLVNLNPEYWLPQIPGKLNGAITTGFLWRNNQWQVDIPTLDIKGALRNLPLWVKGKVAARQASGGVIPLTASIDHLSATIGENTLIASGSLANTWALQAQINAPTLADIHPILQGSIKGDIQLSGLATQPVIDYQLSSPEILFSPFHLTGLETHGRISSGSKIAGLVQLHIAGLSTGDLSLENIQLQVRGDELSHSLTLSTEGKPVAGNIAITGSWQNRQWQGQLTQAQAQTPLDEWSLESPLNISINQQQQAKLTGQCWLSKDARLCLEKTRLSEKQGHVRFQLDSFNLNRLSSFYPPGFDWDSTLSAQGQIQWQGKQPEASLQLNTTPGVLTHGDLSFDYSQLDVLLNFRKQRFSSTLQFQSPKLGIANIEVDIDDIAQQRRLSGNMLLEKLRLDFLAAFVPDIITIDGMVSAKTQLAGTLEKPLIYGDMKIDQGQVTTRSDMVTVTDLTTSLNLQGTKGVIDGSMKVGDGTLLIGGNLDLSELPPAGKITLKGSNLEAKYPGLLEIKVSPDLQFALGKAMMLSGKIVIPWARIEIKDLPKNAIKVSKDAVIVMNSVDHEMQQESAPFNINLEVVLGDDIALDAYGLKTNLGGKLQIQQTSGQSLAGNGSIQLLKGRYRYLGQDLLIQEGNIIFSGPLTNPYLVVDAIRNPDSIQDDVAVGIKVNGTISQPDWNVYSDPVMSQQEQLSYLLRGRGLDNGDDSSLQSLLLGAGINQFGGVVTSVGEAIGLSDVTLDTEGSGADTQVTIGGNITPGLRLQYGAGVFNSIAEIKIRYELMPRLYLQAVSGLTQAVDLFYQFKIETKKKSSGRAPLTKNSSGNVIQPVKGSGT